MNAQSSRATAWLPAVIRLTAAGYLLFFVPNLVLELTHRVNSVFSWTEGADPVAVMFSTVYVVWALFLFGSARDPLADRMFLDFNLAANSAHFGVMLVMAIDMRDEHRHIVGVVAVGVLSTVPLAACWLPVRRRTSRNAWRHKARHGGVGIAQLLP